MKFTDQLNNTLNLQYSPQSIISLVPSITELLAYFNLEDEVIGITKFCFEPTHWFKNKTRIGGTKTVNIKAIKQLKPDLIIANKEENDKAQIEQLQKEFNVFISNIFTLKDALEMITKLGEIFDKKAKATHLNQKIIAEFEQLKNQKPPKIKAAYFIWDKPLMVAASNTFINNMMQLAGFENVFDDLKRYPIITEEQLRTTTPDVLLLSSEPFPFKAKHIAKYQHILPKTKIQLVDGTMFSWYGSRLVGAPGYFAGLREVFSNSDSALN